MSPDYRDVTVLYCMYVCYHLIPSFLKRFWNFLPQREMEAIREEARQAEDSLLSLQSDVKRHEKTISTLKEERSKMRADLQSVKNEYANVLAESAALHRELEQREQAFNELAVQKEELEHNQQMNLTTINNLSERCETIQQELRTTKTERDAFESKMGELEDCLASEQEKTETISHQLERSRDEVNEVLGSKLNCRTRVSY